jgi:hypothetical protein
MTAAASLEAFAPGDGAAWERPYRRWQCIGGPVLSRFRISAWAPR